MATKKRSKIQELVIDKEIKNAVRDAKPRDPKHDTKTSSERHGCDFAELQKENLTALIGAKDAIGMLGEGRKIDRPIYVWRRDGELVIVDGIKTYELAKEYDLSVEVKELAFANIEDAKTWRWYVNVAANRQLPEDARVWGFLQEFDWMIQQWSDEGSKNQGKKRLSSNSEKVNWRERAAELCQTTKSRIDAVYELRRAAEKVALLSDDDRKNLSDEEQAKIKIIEDGVNAVLSGSRTASSVNSDIKGGTSRGSKSTKGDINRRTTEIPDGVLTSYDPSADSQLIVADSLELIKELPEGAFKYMVGSPPYYGANVDYGIKIPWLESWEKYSEAIETYIREAYRIMPEGGGIVLNVDNTRDRKTNRWYYHNELIRGICLDLGMYDAGEICWSKQNVTGKKHAKGSNNRSITRPNHEYVLAFFKGRPYVDFPSYVYGEANHLTLSTWIENTDVEEINVEHWAMFSNFWEIAPANHPDHPAVFPAKLAYRMLTRFTGADDFICDPWTGIGTTLAQCIATGRKYLGIEKGKGYAEKAVKTLAKARKAATQLSIDRLRRIEDYLTSKFVTEDISDGEDTSSVSSSHSTPVESEAIA